MLLVRFGSSWSVPGPQPQRFHFLRSSPRSSWKEHLNIRCSKFLPFARIWSCLFGDSLDGNDCSEAEIMSIWTPRAGACSQINCIYDWKHYPSAFQTLEELVWTWPNWQGRIWGCLTISPKTHRFRTRICIYIYVNNIYIYTYMYIIYYTCFVVTAGNKSKQLIIYQAIAIPTPNPNLVALFITWHKRCWKGGWVSWGMLFTSQLLPWKRYRQQISACNAWSTVCNTICGTLTPTFPTFNFLVSFLRVFLSLGNWHMQEVPTYHTFHTGGWCNFKSRLQREVDPNHAQSFESHGKTINKSRPLTHPSSRVNATSSIHQPPKNLSCNPKLISLCKKKYIVQ